MIQMAFLPRKETMFIKSSGPKITAEQAQELDDRFFESRPFEYFSARISSLLTFAETPVPSTYSSLGSEFASALGIERPSDAFPFEQSDKDLQIATDAFALRHHVAEALIRLYEGLTTAYEPSEITQSVWASIADGPAKTIDLVNSASANLLSQAGRDSFWTFVFPPEITKQASDENTVTALSVMGSWLQHAMNLLTRDDVNVNAAHNKIKHGLAIRARNDLRVTFTTTPPNPDGTVPLSSLKGPEAIDLFDTVTLNYLARPPKQNGHKQGLEMSTLKLPPATLLAEASMMAVTYGAMFRIAADRHFQERKVTRPPYPQLPLGPTPQQLLGNSVVGARYVVTSPPGGGKSARKAGIAFQKGFIPFKIDFDSSQKGVVVDG